MPNRAGITNAPSRWPSHRQRWIRTPDGVDISVREWGDPEGWPILFVHGLAQSHLSFLPQFASPLADRHRLIAYDLRGHGESAKPLDPSFYNEGRRWADELEAVIDGVGSDKAHPGRLVARRTGAPPIPDRITAIVASADSISSRRVPSKIRRCLPRHRAPTSPAVRTRWPSASTPISHSCAHASFASRRKTISPSRSPTTSSCRRRFARRSRAGRPGSRKHERRWPR